MHLLEKCILKRILSAFGAAAGTLKHEAENNSCYVMLHRDTLVNTRYADDGGITDTHHFMRRTCSDSAS